MSLSPEAKQKMREYSRAWYKMNREKRLAQTMEHQRAHREQYNAYGKAQRAKNPEAFKAASKKWRDKPENKEHNRLRMAEYGAKNRKRLTLKKREVRARDPKRYQGYTNKWLRAHPEVVRANRDKRRALMHAATVNLKSMVAWMEGVKSKPSAVCYYCQQEIEVSQIHFDHVIALSKGGAHSVENLCVSCSRCNLSKGNRPIGVWITTGQQLFPI
jgi:5-methylcytosine-specific restriction endonuclease McrA